MVQLCSLYQVDSDILQSVSKSSHFQMWLIWTEFVLLLEWFRRFAVTWNIVSIKSIIESALEY